VSLAVKHILILSMLAIGFRYNFFQNSGPALRSYPSDAQRIAHFRRCCNAMTVCGILALLLTAVAPLA
jgi:hypothetical protein